MVEVGAAEVHLLDGMRADCKEVMVALLLTVMRFLDIGGVMLPFPVVKLLGRGHQLPLRADLVVLAGAAALVELYLHHFGQSAAVLVGGRGRVLGLGQLLGLEGQRVEREAIRVDLLYAVRNEVVEGLY